MLSLVSHYPGCRTGLLGRACLLRAICEAPSFLAPGDNVVAELLRVVLQ